MKTKYFLGQLVFTDIGEGTIVELFYSHNGLNINYTSGGCVVWFGVGNNKHGWTSKTFALNELKEFN